jgi:hypothetical protein
MSNLSLGPSWSLSTPHGIFEPFAAFADRQESAGWNASCYAPSHHSIRRSEGRVNSRANLFGQVVCEIEQNVGVTRCIQGAPTGKVFASQSDARIALPFLGGFGVDPALKGRDRCFSSAQGQLSRDPIAPFAGTPDVNGR